MCQFYELGQKSLTFLSLGLSAHKLETVKPTWWLSGKESTCQCGRQGSIPVWGRSPGEGNGNPLQDACLENPMDSGAWRATVHGVAKRHNGATKQTTLWSHRTVFVGNIPEALSCDTQHTLCGSRKSMVILRTRICRKSARMIKQMR